MTNPLRLYDDDDKTPSDSAVQPGAYPQRNGRPPTPHIPDDELGLDDPWMDNEQRWLDDQREAERSAHFYSSDVLGDNDDDDQGDDASSQFAQAFDVTDWRTASTFDELTEALAMFDYTLIAEDEFNKTLNEERSRTFDMVAAQYDVQVDRLTQDVKDADREIDELVGSVMEAVSVQAELTSDRNDLFAQLGAIDRDHDDDLARVRAEEQAKAVRQLAAFSATPPVSTGRKIGFLALAALALFGVAFIGQAIVEPGGIVHQFTTFVGGR